MTARSSTERDLYVAIPSGAPTAAQQSAMNAAQQYGQDNGVNVIYVHVTISPQ